MRKSISIYSRRIGEEWKLLFEHIEIADTFFSRIKGLLAREGFGDCNGMLLTPCGYVHTFGMKFDIDLVFLDRDKRVVDCRHSMGANSWAGKINAKHTLELPAGILKSLNLKMGDELRWGRKNDIKKTCDFQNFSE